MSKHNYTQYSNKKDDNVLQPADIITDEVVEATIDEVVVPAVEVAEQPVVEEVKDPVIEEPAKPKTVKGAVANCTKLNVRVKPTTDAEVVCVLDGKSEVEVDIARSTSDWFKVHTASGVDGFCMRKYVDVRL